MPSACFCQAAKPKPVVGSAVYSDQDICDNESREPRRCDLMGWTAPASGIEMP
jgi:hypothetical protein